MLSEISQVVKDKYHVISPLTGTQSTKQTSKQNITKDIQIGKKLTVSRRERGGDNRGKGEGFTGTTIKVHMDNNKVGWKKGREVWKAGMVGREGRKG